MDVETAISFPSSSAAANECILFDMDSPAIETTILPKVSIPEISGR